MYRPYHEKCPRCGTGLEIFSPTEAGARCVCRGCGVSGEFVDRYDSCERDTYRAFLVAIEERMLKDSMPPPEVPRAPPLPPRPRS